MDLLLDVPEPLRIASLPVASIVETIADGGANSALAHIRQSKFKLSVMSCFETSIPEAKFFFGWSQTISRSLLVAKAMSSEYCA